MNLSKLENLEHISICEQFLSRKNSVSKKSFGYIDKSAENTKSGTEIAKTLEEKSVKNITHNESAQPIAIAIGALSVLGASFFVPWDYLILAIATGGIAYTILQCGQPQPALLVSETSKDSTIKVIKEDSGFVDKINPVPKDAVELVQDKRKYTSLSDIYKNVKGLRFPFNRPVSNYVWAVFMVRHKDSDHLLDESLYIYGKDEKDNPMFYSCFLMRTEAIQYPSEKPITTKVNPVTALGKMLWKNIVDKTVDSPSSKEIKATIMFADCTKDLIENPHTVAESFNNCLQKTTWMTTKQGNELLNLIKQEQARTDIRYLFDKTLTPYPVCIVSPDQKIPCANWVTYMTDKAKIDFPTDDWCSTETIAKLDC